VDARGWIRSHSTPISAQYAAMSGNLSLAKMMTDFEINSLRTGL
jgi:hypothetical protein